MSEKTTIQKLGVWLKLHLDAVILSVNTLVISIIGIGSLWALGVILQESIYDLLIAFDIILLLIIVNVLGILMLSGRKRSALFPLILIIMQCFVFFIFMFVNLLFSVLLGLNVVAAIFCMKKRPIIPRFKTRNGFYTLILLILLLTSPFILFFGVV